MAEEHPESPTGAARIYIAGLALACAFRAVDHYEWPWTTDSAVSAGLSAMLTIGDWKLPWILHRAGPRSTRFLNLLASDPRWWIASILVYLLVGTFSPVIEQKRWPFSVWFAGPSQEEVDSLHARLNATAKDLNDAQQQIAREPAQRAADLAKLRSEGAATQQQLDSARAELAKARKDTENANSQIAELQKKLEETKKTESYPSLLPTSKTTLGLWSPTLSSSTLLSILAPLTTLPLEQPPNQANIVGSVRLHYNAYSNSLELISNDDAIAKIDVGQETSSITSTMLPLFSLKVSFKSESGPFEVRIAGSDPDILIGRSAPVSYSVSENTKSYVKIGMDLSNRSSGLSIGTTPSEITMTFYKRGS